MRKRTLDELLKKKGGLSYLEQYEYIYDLIEKGTIQPIKSAGTNGKSPSLPLAYRVIEEEKDYSSLIEELKFGISTKISIDYYIKHPKIYEKEREWVLQLSQYLESTKQEKEIPMISLNERSFQIWNREKFLQKEQGKKILNHCGLSLEKLNIYFTSEPLAYYSVSRVTPQTLLIIENKDTFYSMRKYLMNRDFECSILGKDIKTLVYGAGKGILRSIEDFSFCVEPYMNHPDNKYLYFGDLDYEGIGIYERLADLLRSHYKLIPFVEAYQKMISKAEHCDKLPDTKEGQNKNLSGHFLSFFEESAVQKIMKILNEGKYIPQEILNISDIQM